MPDTLKKPPATKNDCTNALIRLRGFIGRSQLSAIASACRGEEKQFFFDKMVELADRVDAMPSTKETEGQDDAAVIHLHYFAGGQANWYITEKDKGAPDDVANSVPPQSQAFGRADLFGDGGELGYISIAEIIANGGELDFYWTPKTLAELKAERESNTRQDWQCPTCKKNNFSAPAEGCLNPKCPASPKHDDSSDPTSVDYEPAEKLVVIEGKPAVIRNPKSSLLNRPPPDGWKDSDRVPPASRNAPQLASPPSTKNHQTKTPMPEQTEVILTRGKECKGSVRFETTDPDAPISNIYLSRKDPASKGQKIIVTIAPAE